MCDWQDDDEPIADEAPTGPVFDVCEVGGRHLYHARRLSSGNWLLVGVTIPVRRTVNHKTYQRDYERVTLPRDDRQAD